MSILLVTQIMFVSDKINIIGSNILYFKFTNNIIFIYKYNINILLKTIIFILSILILFMALV